MHHYAAIVLTMFYLISLLYFCHMLPTISLFVFKHRITKNGEVCIYIRFTNDRKSSYKSTGISVPKNMWDFSKNKVKSTYKLSTPINMLLEKKISEIRHDLLIKAMKVNTITSKQAKKLAFNNLNRSFFALALEYQNDFVKSGNIGMKDRVKTVLAKFERFLGGRTATFYDIDLQVITDFQNYLKNEYGNKVNTIQSNLKTIRRVFSIAIERGIITPNDDPFRSFKIKQEKALREFLTKEEVAKIMYLDLSHDKKLEMYRDIFIWTILSGGLRVSDVIMLRKSNIDGQYLNMVIQKTKTPHRIKMPPQAFQILNRFMARMSKEDGFVFGLIAEHAFNADAKTLDKAVATATYVYNKALKSIGTLAGIAKPISSHFCRISYVSISAQGGVPLTTIQNVVKHSKLEMTAHYSKFTDSQGDNALLLLENLITKQ